MHFGAHKPHVGRQVLRSSTQRNEITDLQHQVRFGAQLFAAAHDIEDAILRVSLAELGNTLACGLFILQQRPPQNHIVPIILLVLQFCRQTFDAFDVHLELFSKQISWYGCWERCVNHNTFPLFIEAGFVSSVIGIVISCPLR